MDFEKEDFQNMMFNVHELSGRQSVLKAFPKLSQFNEFDSERFRKQAGGKKAGEDEEETTNLTLDKVLRYIMYVYDKESPLRKKIQDVLKRKAVALELSGFIKKNESWGVDVERMVMCQDKFINMMIIRFLKLHRYSKYLHVAALEEGYTKMLDKVMSGDITSQEYSVFEKQQSKMEALSIEIANDDNTEELIEDLYMVIDYEKLDIMPEDIAEKLEKGESIL